MKPRVGDGLLETIREGKKIVMRVPANKDGRLVVGLSPEEVREPGTEFVAVVE